MLRTALEANRRSPALAARLAHILIGSGRGAEALRLLDRSAAQPEPDHAVLAAQAAAQKSLNQPDAALATYMRAARLYPDSPVAHHNLAAHQGDLGQFAAAGRSAAQALAKGGQAAQTWLVYARALLGNGRLDEAEHAFRQALRRNPAEASAHRELAQLIWMRTEDSSAATALLDAHIQAHPERADLFALRANILHHAGDAPAAYATLQHAITRHPDQPALHLAAAQLAALLPGGAAHGVAHAERALALLPGHPDAEAALCAACLADGAADRAAAIAADLAHRRPQDQRALAYLSTAWRLLDDPRYGELYDYAAFVRAWRMDVPDGWPTLDAYLAALTQALGGVHPFRTHPLDQSVRHGSQATHLRASPDPVIRAFFQAVDGPIRRHLAALDAGADPLRARNAGTFRFHGAWSVRLRPGGFHTDHIHPEGWLSSACYIALPATESPGREAWIKFGQPGIPTAPALPAEHFIRPEPGMLVLFPSYMWHGTVPFSGALPRLSVAFDLTP